MPHGSRQGIMLLGSFLCVWTFTLTSAFTLPRDHAIWVPAISRRSPCLFQGAFPLDPSLESRYGLARTRQRHVLFSQADARRPIRSSSGASSRVLLEESSQQLQRLSWFSWWSQVILTTIATVILVFAKNVGSTTGVTTTGANYYHPLNLLLSSMGVLVSGVSILWTWGNGARLSRRILKGNVPTAARLLSKAIRVQVTLNLVGLLGSVLAAQQIVGTLAIKVLTRQAVALGNAVEGLQPLDILVVQANNNTLLSHFVSLVCSLLLTKIVRRMNPLPERDESD